MNNQQALQLGRAIKELRMHAHSNIYEPRIELTQNRAEQIADQLAMAFGLRDCFSLQAARQLDDGRDFTHDELLDEFKG